MSEVHAPMHPSTCTPVLVTHATGDASRVTCPWVLQYRSTSLIRKRPPLGPYRRPIPRVIWGSQGGGRFLMGEVPLQEHRDPLGAVRVLNFKQPLYPTPATGVPHL